MKPLRMKNSTILWEGECAYVCRTGECYEIMVYSTNSVNHRPAGITDNAARAESTCKRLNAYPRHTRQSYGLI